MRRFVVAASTLCAVAFVGQVSAATAAAAQSRSAVETVAELEAAGHHVQLNGSANVPLSQCKVTGVHGLNNSNIDSSGNRIDENLYTTVYVDVSCQTAN
jgi:hypothetical protein